MANVTIPLDTVTLATCEAWHAQLLEALRRGGGLALDLSETAEMDLAGLQLVLAAARAAVGGGQDLIVPAHLSPAAAKAFARAALDPKSLWPAGPSPELP